MRASSWRRGRRGLPRWSPRRGRGGHTGAVGCVGATASLSPVDDLIRQMDRIRSGAATNMMTSAMMKTEQVERDPRLDPHQLAARGQRAEQERGEHDATRPQTGQQGERDRGEPDPAGQVERKLADRADHHE